MKMLNSYLDRQRTLKRELILASIGAAVACAFMYGALWLAVWFAVLLSP